MAWFKQGDLFLSTSISKNMAGESMWQYDGTSFSKIASFVDGSSGATGTDGVNGHDGAYLSPWNQIWMTHFFGRVEIRNAAGATVREIATAELPETVAFDRVGFAYVGQQGGARIDKFRLDGTSVSSYTPAAGGRGSDQVEMHANGYMLLYTSESEVIRQWDTRTGTQGPDFATLTGEVFASYGIGRVPGDGSYVVVVEDGDRGRVDRFSATGTFLRSYLLPSPYWLPFGIDVEADSQHCWVGVKWDWDAPGGAAYTDISDAAGIRMNLASGAIVRTIDLGVLTRSVDGVTANVLKLRSPLMKVA